jgi:glycosyltransferase involved in cell wall biosynthesis
MISIVIPAYKAEKYIEETIRSVMQQTITDWEMIVIDDGSPDKLGDVVKKIQLENSRIQYVKQKNGGVASARNHGFRLSKGSYLAFLDADDVWLPDNLELKIEKFKQDAKIGLVHSDTAIIDENSRTTGEVKSGKEGELLEDLLFWKGTNVMPPSGILIKRDVLLDVGLFDEELSNSADQELYFRVASKYKIGRVDKVTWHYRVHHTNMHKNIKLMESDLLKTYQKASQNKLFKSHWFKLSCYSKMFRILGASWWKDGNSKIKGAYYLLKSFLYNPLVFIYSFINKNN